MTASSEPWLDRARHFFENELWTRELRPRTLATAGVRCLQLCVVVIENFVRDQLFLRVGSLTYISILSMIPLIAMVLSVLKAVGVSGNVAEYIVEQFPAVTAEARTQLLQLIEAVDFGSLGTLGAVVFLGATILALRHLESTLNDIWGVGQTRGWARRFADYLAVVIVGPLLIAVALSLGATLQAIPLVTWLASLPGLDWLYSLCIQWVPVGLVAVALSFLYWFFPNTQVKLGSALLGGILAAILFTAAQYYYVAFNVGVAKYNALFGGFAVLPLLVIWIYASWSIVLLGAEIAFAHQNLGQYRREVQDRPVGAAEREALGIRIVLYVARSFRDRTPAFTAGELADRLDTSVRTVNAIVAQLEGAGLLSSTVGGKRGRAHQLGRPADGIFIADILNGMRGARREREGDDDGIGVAVESLLAELRGLESGLLEGRSVADLLRDL